MSLEKAPPPVTLPPLPDPAARRLRIWNTVASLDSSGTLSTSKDHPHLSADEVESPGICYYCSYRKDTLSHLDVILDPPAPSYPLVCPACLKDIVDGWLAREVPA